MLNVKTKNNFQFLIWIAVVIGVVYIVTKNRNQVERVPTYREKIESHLSTWDGSHPAIEAYIKKNMNDPESYEHVKTTFFVPQDTNQKQIVFKTTFRGKNAFGAVILNTVAAKCDIETGQLVEVIPQ